MRNIWALAKREVLSFFVSPVAYLVITGFVMLSGYFFFNLVGFYNLYLEQMAAQPFRGPQAGVSLNRFVAEGFYHTLIVILVFLIPMFTMRLIAEEKRRGTFELLVTSPVTVSEIVFGKFLGLAFVIFCMLGLSAAFPLLLLIAGEPEVLPLISGWLALFLCALAFASIGMAVSSFTENQIVAAVTSMVVLLLLYVIQSPAESLGGTWATVLNYLSPVMQARDMIRGIVSLKGCIYFLSLITVGVFLSHRALEMYRWR